MTTYSGELYIYYGPPHYTEDGAFTGICADVRKPLGKATGSITLDRQAGIARVVMQISASGNNWQVRTKATLVANVVLARFSLAHEKQHSLASSLELRLQEHDEYVEVNGRLDVADSYPMTLEGDLEVTVQPGTPADPHASASLRREGG